MNKVGYKTVYVFQFHFVKKESEKKEVRRKGGRKRGRDGGREEQGVPVHPDLVPVAELLLN